MAGDCRLRVGRCRPIRLQEMFLSYENLYVIFNCAKNFPYYGMQIHLLKFLRFPHVAYHSIRLYVLKASDACTLWNETIGKAIKKFISSELFWIIRWPISSTCRLWLGDMKITLFILLRGPLSVLCSQSDCFVCCPVFHDTDRSTRIASHNNRKIQNWISFKKLQKHCNDTKNKK